MRWVLCLAAALLFSPAIAGDFSDWAAIVVAGDSNAHSGTPSEVFDNARKAISGELVDIGFKPDNIAQFSVHPDKYPEHPEFSEPQHIASILSEVSHRTAGGCFAYLTSHGSGDGIVIGDTLMSPRYLAHAVDAACAGKPVVVIVSSCFSGVFVEPLKAPERIVLTAAAPNRSSFGCGEDDKYNYFDTCTVALMPKAGDFESLGEEAKACVEAREKKEHMSPPSNPQLFVGDKARDLIPHWK